MINDSIERTGVHLVALAATELGLIFRELPTSDQGIDGQFEFLDQRSRGDGRLIAVQIKAGKSYFSEQNDDAFIYRPSSSHRDLWINHSLPVIVILCDPDSKQCYWEVVTSESCRTTGGGWRIDIPKSNLLSSREALAEIATPVAAASEFTVSQIQDVSHALARRISMDIIVHSHAKALTKVKLAAIVRAAVSIGRDTDYSRDEISAAAHKGRAADMVSGFLYLRDQDRSAAQWVCRFQWTSADINPLAQYQGVVGELDSEGLVIEWRFDRTIPELIDSLRLSKGEYLLRADNLLASFDAVKLEVGNFCELGCPIEQSADIRRLSARFEASWDNNNSAPVECERLDQAIAELLASVGNLRFIWAENTKYSFSGAKHATLGIQSDLERICSEIAFLRREVR